MIHSITVIRARRGKRLAKLIYPDGKILDYDAVYTYDLIPRPVADLDALHCLLARLLHRPDCAVVRGVPIDPDRCDNVRRLAFACNKTGDLPTLRPEPHAWIALDLDEIERPADILATNLPACATAAIQRLPEAFHGVRCIVQASASHGLKKGSRLRIWYWLDRDASDPEVKHWLRGAPVDPSVFRTVQPIYTAAPLFADGVQDHLPHRIVSLPGRPVVPVPSADELTPPPAKPAAELPKPTDAGSGSYAFAALTHAAVRVRNADVGQRHDTILREARGLARLISAGLLTRSSVADTLRGAGMVAGKPEDEIASIITWAMDHPSGAPLPKGIGR